MAALFEKIIIKFHQYRFRFIFSKDYKKGWTYGPFSIIHPRNLSFGRGFTLNDYCYINATHKVIIGDNVAVSAGAKIITVKLHFSDHNEFSGELSHVGEEIIIGSNVQIGANAVILSGVHICDNVIIGAGAVVAKNITEAGIYVGVPAKKIEKR